MDKGKELQKSEMEAMTGVVMTELREISKINADKDIEISKANIESQKEITIRGMDHTHSERLRIIRMVEGISAMGGGTGIALIILGKPEFGIPMVTGVITGVLGFLGGKSLTK
jgi:S-ribosylhomocysteine lyase LuxS involved in autoinducer biosynthesis